MAVFLRKLNFYDGVLLLTTNLVHQFHNVILNRIQLAMSYEKLEKAVRETIITPLPGKRQLVEVCRILAQNM